MTPSSRPDGMAAPLGGCVPSDRPAPFGAQRDTVSLAEAHTRTDARAAEASARAERVRCPPVPVGSSRPGMRTQTGRAGVRSAPGLLGRGRTAVYGTQFRVARAVFDALAGLDPGAVRLAATLLGFIAPHARSSRLVRNGPVERDAPRRGRAHASGGARREPLPVATARRPRSLGVTAPVLAHPRPRRSSSVRLWIAQVALAALLGAVAALLETRGLAEGTLLSAGGAVLVASALLLVVWSDTSDERDGPALGG